MMWAGADVGRHRVSQGRCQGRCGQAQSKSTEWVRMSG